MITWENIVAGMRHDFNFRDLTEVHANIQRNNTYLCFKEPDGTRFVYRLIGYPELPVVGINVSFAVEMYRPNGELIGLRNDLRGYSFEEPEEFVPLFAMYPAPYGGLVFGLQQAINGLTRQLPQFEGHETLQTGHMLYSMDAEGVQPVTFNVAQTDETVTDDGEGNYTPNGDGSISLTAIDGSGPFEFSINGGETYQPTGVFKNLSAGEYTVASRDALGIWHAKKVTLNVPEEPAE